MIPDLSIDNRDRLLTTARPYAGNRLQALAFNLLSVNEERSVGDLNSLALDGYQSVEARLAIKLYLNHIPNDRQPP
jgi:hypothetical protein